MKTTRCDGCHKKRVLMFFRNNVDSGYVAYCRKCAILMGYYNDSKELYGSAISNAKQHSSHDRSGHRFASTNEGKNEEMRGITTPALQL